jgi:hypothetical protein
MTYGGYISDDDDDDVQFTGEISKLAIEKFYTPKSKDDKNGKHGKRRKDGQDGQDGQNSEEI